MSPLAGMAQNPIVQTMYTADPAPMVSGDRLFLYTSHDEDNSTWFVMNNWKLYSTTDMVNWTDHGVVLSLKTFDWAQSDAWAMQCVERDGKYYAYVPVTKKGGGGAIGVAVADSPYGPFYDPLGKPLVSSGRGDIDPSVMIDEDGQAYLYWGNPFCYYVKLNEDMISYSGEIMKFGQLKTYQEGPWFYKRNGKYYLAFASTCCPEGIGYAMSDGPLGPWEVKGYIMAPTNRDRGNHPGIIDYKGKSYVFGQNYDLLRLEMKEHHERRSVAAAEMHYNVDGTIQEVPYFLDTKLEPIENFNPYRRVEAETMAWGYGLKTNKFEKGGIYVTSVDDGDTLKLRSVDFGKKGAKRFTACVASAKGNCSIEIHLDHANGPLVGTVQVASTGSMEQYKEMECKVKGAKGVHDLVFRFKGNGQKDLLNWDYWKFE